MHKKEYSLEVGGRTLTATFTDLADQTNGSVLIRYGDTLVLATAVMSQNKREDIDYFPLTVEYEERYYASGKIGGARFIKREGRPSEEAVLSGRIVDRTIRPFFDSAIRNEIQVVLTVLALDENNDADVPTVIGASLALATSDIPWDGPVGATRLGLAKDNLNDFIINPTFAERAECQLDLLVCAKNGHLNMVETEAREVSEDKIGEGFKLATSEINKIEVWQKQIISEIGKTKRKMETPVISEEAKALFAEFIEPKVNEAIFETISDNASPKKSADSLKEDWLSLRAEKMPEANLGAWLGYFEEIINERLHHEALNNSRRPDGRQLNEIRPLYSQAGGFSNVVHGVGLFYRGATHVLTTLTLSGPQDSLIVKGMEADSKKFFMHHYNFPPFSVGETGRVGSPSRRSIGHGALAEKSLRAVIPPREIFPYTIRLVSEVFASNGSSSQASVCASSLALMDGGVPIKAPVAGISVGLMMKDETTYRLLADIQGLEDHYGDMDFKVAGTAQGITGIQLDIKTAGIPIKILIEALAEAKKARLQILESIHEAIPAPRPEVSPSAPKIIQITIPVDKIGAVIGSGGKTIQEISEKYSVEIDIEEDGVVYITGKIDDVNNAKAIIEDIAREYKVGDRFEGEVVRLMDFGAFVKIGHDTDGLVHISELAPFHVGKVTDIVQLGEMVPVMVKEIDERGRINLSLKAADPDFSKKKGIVPKNRPSRPFERGS